MGPHEWLGVPRIPSPARDLRIVPFFAASAAAHVALVLALSDVAAPEEQRTPASEDIVVMNHVESRAHGAQAHAEASEWAKVEAAPGSRVALALDTAGRRAAGGRDAAGGDPEIGTQTGGVDLRELVHEGSWASVTGTADLEDGLTGFAAGDLTAGDMAGGFAVGTVGGACCGGGQSWVTIGTGRYGTIGQGSGATYNYGGPPGDTGGRYRRARVPHATIARPVVTCASCDPAVFYRAFRGCVSTIQYCYEKELIAFPGLGHVKLQVRFVVLPGGNIANVVLGAGGNDGLRRCIRGHYQAMRVNKNVDEPVGIELDLGFVPSR